MTPTDLLGRLIRREKSDIEFLSEAACPEGLAKHTVATAYLTGGSVLFGVGDDGTDDFVRVSPPAVAPAVASER